MLDWIFKIAFTVISGVVVYQLYKKKSPWLFILVYWAVSLLKNVLVLLGVL